MKYANRESEYDMVKRLLEKNASPIIINAYPASGVTSFVQEKLHDCVFSIYGRNVFYVDASTQESLGNSLITQVILSGNQDRLQSIADEKFGAYNKSILSSILEGIPYAGPVLGRIVEQKNAIPVYSGVYSSVLEEFLMPFFKNASNNSRYLIIIDSVQDLAEMSYNLLTSLMRCDSVQFILLKTNANTQFDKLLNFLFVQKVNTTFQVEFDLPHIKLIKELASLYDISLSTGDAESILSHTHQNIHAIIKEIREVQARKRFPEFSTWEKAIVSVLDIWSGPMKKSSLFDVVLLCGIYDLNPATSFENALELLTKQSFILQEGQGIVLTRRHDPQIVAITSNLADQLFYKNTVYNYLVQNNSTQFELRYRISNELNCTTDADAKAYFRYLLLYGYPIPSDVLYNARLKKGIYYDCLLASMKYCSERRYQDALEWIEAIPQDQMNLDIRCYRATLLNRVHRSKEAEEQLLQCIERVTIPSTQNLLMAFLVSTYIHMERLSDAQDVYEKGKELFPDGPLRGYLIRNATSAFSTYKGDMYSAALDDFKRDGDDFGYYTTLCNQGYALCKNGNVLEGKKALEAAKKGLELFPHSNLHIIYNDLGICHLLLDESDTAIHYFTLANSLSVNTIPTIFSTINLACTEAVMGSTETALKKLDAIESCVESHRLDRVRQQYYINRLMVEYLHGNKNIGHYIRMASKYIDRYNPNRTIQIVGRYKRYLGTKKQARKYNWRNLYFPCGLVYWYMEPLKLLPAGII